MHARGGKEEEERINRRVIAMRFTLIIIIDCIFIHMYTHIIYIYMQIIDVNLLKV